MEDLCLLFERLQYIVNRHSWGDAEPKEPAACDLIVLDAGPCAVEALHVCRRLRAQLGDRFVPILFLAGEAGTDSCSSAFSAGADVCLQLPLAPGELQAQVRALLRIKSHHDRLEDRSAETHRMNKQLQSSHQRISQELELARRIQLSLLPQSLPEVPRTRFAVQYRPCGRVGGDFYDAFRLDENHVGFYVADAMGHGIPASLLTMYLKRGVRGKKITGNSYRLNPPDEVLGTLNRDLVELSLAENPFITMVYALLNFREGVLHFARAGHPYPLLLPATGEPQFLKASGSLLGVFQTTYTTRTECLRPGDKVLFYTDGTDTISLGDCAPGAESLAAGAARHRALPMAELVHHLTHDLFHQATPPDDFTLLGLEFGE
jgi:sigma-B regulation protein RsbU (phosphoserine phosphatase)